MSSDVLFPQMLATNTVPSDEEYLRSWSAVDGIGFGVLGGRIEGCGLSLPLGRPRAPVRGVPNSLEVRGASAAVGIAEIYEASSDTCMCARRSRMTSGGLDGSPGFSSGGFLIRSTNRECNCSSEVGKCAET